MQDMPTSVVLIGLDPDDEKHVEQSLHDIWLSLSIASHPHIDDAWPELWGPELTEKSPTPDLIILGHNISLLQAIAFIEQKTSQKRTKEIPVAVYSPHSAAISPLHSHSYGVHAILTKDRLMSDMMELKSLMIEFWFSSQAQNIAQG